MTVYRADGITSELHRNVVRLRASLPPNSARKCGGACAGEAVQETVRQWVDGAWYDVVWISCLNITPMPREVRHRLAAERDIPAGKPIKCGWREEISRVARPDIPPPILQTKVEVPQMATKTKKAPPCPRCGGDGQKWRTGSGIETDVCKDCVRAKMSESARKRQEKDRERREHARRLAAQEAEQVFEVQMAEAAMVDEQPVTEADLPVLTMRPYAGDLLGGSEVHAEYAVIEPAPEPAPLVSANGADKTPERDVLDSVTEQLLTMSLGDLMRRKQRHPRRVSERLTTGATRRRTPSTASSWWPSSWR